PPAARRAARAAAGAPGTRSRRRRATPRPRPGAGLRAAVARRSGVRRTRITRLSDFLPCQNGSRAARTGKGVLREMDDVIAVILGGGRGSRLFPLTLLRSKPAVPIGGKYRLIDIPISNCLNSELRRIFVLTQYNSESLNTHLARTYKFDIFSS